MNPLFTAHLIADFLLQPNDLVAWKERSVAGVFMHSFVHLIVMAAMILSFDPSLWPTVCAIATMHTVIDQWKISYKKRYRSFIGSFLVDQGAHLAAIFAFYFVMPVKLQFWKTQAGIGISIVMLIASLLLGMWHLGIFDHMMPRIRGKQMTTILLMLATFVMFIIPAILV